MAKITRKTRGTAAGPRSRRPDRFERIVVPTDLTDTTRRALDIAMRIARSPRPEITVLHVIETIPNVAFEELASFYTQLEQQAVTKMRAIVARMRHRTPMVKLRIGYGRRADEIVRYAAEHGADLIVLTSHKVSLRRPSRPDVGTISYKVGILAQCDVLLLK